MANRFKGEIESATGHRLVLDYNAFAEFEDLTGRPALDVIAGFQTGAARVSDIRALVFACLRRHHPDLTVHDAGDILSEEPDIFMKVLSAAAPEPETPSGNGPKPRKESRG